MSKIVPILVLFLAAAQVWADDDHAEASINFKEDTFNEQVAKKPHLVMFFAPWCGHCKRLAPTWQDLSVKYNEKDPEDQDVLIGKVDCTIETALCSAQDVTGYPTLKFFKSGTDSGVKYRGQRDLDSLVKFINEQMGVEVPEEEAVESQEAKVDNGLWILSEKSFKETVAKGDVFIKFYAPWCGHCQRMAPTFAELGAKYKDSDKVKIAKLDCTQAQDICQSNQVRGYPTLHYFRDGKILETYKGARDLSAMADFVDTLVSGEEKKPAEEAPTDVIKMDKENFDTEKGVSFVKFFAPWCGHCKRLAPTWEELAQKFKNTENVKIGKVDCTEGSDKNRELCDGNGVTGFPTLNLYKDGKLVEEYKGKRTLEDLEAFVQKHLSSKDEL